MATPSAALLCCLVALLLWTGPGYLIAWRLRVAPDLRAAVAPILGWGVGNVAALNAATLFGFSPLTVLATTSTIAVGAALGPALRAAPKQGPSRMPLWVVAAAAVVAVAPAMAVLPKVSAAGVALADAIYDHSKIALVDEMVRSGVPPANPFVGAPDGGAGTTAYYYYWLFGAAQLARITGAGGWAADAAATWFTAFASLSLMCGLAFRLGGGRAAAPVFVLATVCGASLRPIIVVLLGHERADAMLLDSLAGWLFQTSWSPHHVAAATAVVLTLVFMERLAREAPTTGDSLGPAVVIGALVAAAFGSSLWVGGITFVLCAAAATAVLTGCAAAGRRLAFLAALSVAAVVAVVLVLPLLTAQFHAAAARGGGPQVTIAPCPVFGPAIPAALSGWLDLPAYWLILLPVAFPAASILGAVAAFRLKSREVPVLSAAALASLCGGWLLVSTAGTNNDLGWRAILPAILILTAFAGAWFAHALYRRRIAATCAAIALAGLALPDGLRLVRDNVAGRLSADGARFADAPALWAAVRRHAGVDARVAGNPRLMSGLTPWPINLSWALLADRRSCFAGEEYALAFAAWSQPARAAAAARFERVFAGTGSTEDLGALVGDFGCQVIVLTPQDGAFDRDPFAHDPRFILLEDAPGRFRIWRANR